MTDPLKYLELANTYPSLNPADFARRVNITLLTNFTDAVLQKLLIGSCLAAGIYPELSAVPYKQYHFELKNPNSFLYIKRADITFVWLDINQYRDNEFTRAPSHFDEVLHDLKNYAQITAGLVVINTFLVPYRTPYGELRSASPLYQTVTNCNEELKKFSSENANVHLCDTNAIVHELGERHCRDLRGHYAFDLPFTAEFSARVAELWRAYIRAKLGQTKKCIVLDLDNVLWGGIVGEAGPLGVELGPDYPGNAYQNFQRVLLEYYNRGVILAINSKNNPEDVDEIFAQNPHMILRPEHFAAVYANWNDKATNLKAIAAELNIGLDSLVFLDDEPINRDLVRTQLPEVLTPEFSLPPEAYVPTLLSLDVFHQLSFTDEDRERGRMYAVERQRRGLQTSTSDITEYLAGLDIIVSIACNESSHIPRVSQLTQKSNQFNLTTRRYTEHEMAEFIKNGYRIYTGDVRDKFGEYGITNIAIVTPPVAGVAELDSFLMSCRVIGRNVQHAFLHYIIKELAASGVRTLTGSFLPTAKNKLCRPFLDEMGFALVEEEDGGARHYSLNLADYLSRPAPFPEGFLTVSPAKP